MNISSTSDNVNLCVRIQQVVNTGPVANQLGVSQYNTEDGDGLLFGDRFDFFEGFDNGTDINLEGSSIQINPDQVVQCQQTIIQAAASGTPLVGSSSSVLAAPAQRGHSGCRGVWRGRRRSFAGSSCRPRFGAGAAAEDGGTVVPTLLGRPGLVRG